MLDSTISLRTNHAYRCPTRPAVLPLECVGVSIARHGRTLLDRVDILFDGLGVTAVMGPNGAGKTLLLRVLANLVAPDRGVVRWAGPPPARAIGRRTSQGPAEPQVRSGDCENAAASGAGTRRGNTGIGLALAPCPQPRPPPVRRRATAPCVSTCVGAGTRHPAARRTNLEPRSGIYARD